MVTIGANRDKISYGIKHYNVDTEEDRLSIRTLTLTPGSTAFVIENSKHYMLNGARKWVEIQPFGRGSAGGQDGGDIDDTNKPTTPPDSGDSDDNGDGYYDGGDLDA